GRPARDRGQRLLARAGRGARGRADVAPPAAAGPGRAPALAGRPFPGGPHADGDRGALPDRPDRCDLADRNGAPPPGAERAGPGHGAAGDDPALPGPDADGRSGAHLAGGLTAGSDHPRGLGESWRGLGSGSPTRAEWPLSWPIWWLAPYSCPAAGGG